MMCGECSRKWARENYPKRCQPCPGGSAVLLSAAILADILQKAGLSFVVAAMAATTAVKGSAKLHTSMIRHSLRLTYTYIHFHIYYGLCICF